MEGQESILFWPCKVRIARSSAQATLQRAHVGPLKIFADIARLQTTAAPIEPGTQRMQPKAGPRRSSLNEARHAHTSFAAEQPYSLTIQLHVFTDHSSCLLLRCEVIDV